VLTYMKWAVNMYQPGRLVEHVNLCRGFTSSIFIVLWVVKSVTSHSLIEWLLYLMFRIKKYVVILLTFTSTTWR